MIKQIQLRGISRTPSDRATADGGCAESLNVHLSEKELAPTLPPKDVTAELGLPANEGRDYIYIHKGNGYTNYVTLDGLEIGAYVGGVYERIDSLVQGETLQSVSSIGNTLVIMGDKHPYYALFKNGHYIFLGNTIPLPTIKIWPEPVKDEDGEYVTEVITDHDNPITPYSVVFDKDTWNEKAREAEGDNKRYAGVENLSEDLDEEGYYEDEDILQVFKKKAKEIYAQAKSDSVLINQVMVLYGVRLYNDSYITSVPYLMPGGFEWPIFCRYYREAADYGSDVYSTSEVLQIGARYPYRVKAQMLDFNEEQLSLWSDIIMSIDFFLTPIIPFDATNEKVAYVAREYVPSRTSDFPAGVVTGNITSFEIQPCSNKYARNYINRVLANGSGEFRKAESISTDRMSFEANERLGELREGTLLDFNDYISSQDLLNTQSPLSDFSYDMRNSERIGKSVTGMNNRILLTGVTETLSSGSLVFPAAPCKMNESDDGNPIPFIEESYREYPSSMSALGYWRKYNSSFDFPQGDKYVQLVYHLQGRETYTVRGRIGANGGFVEQTDGSIGYFGFLVFPDPRCKSVDIYMSYDNEVWYSKSYEMREYPRLDCSYMYAGLETNILWDIAHVDMSYDNTGHSQYQDNRLDAAMANVSMITENRIEQRDNVLLLSDADNPWFFPLENEYTLQATKIIGTALATKALSTGQFGQFPLYVFTDNGIWAMQMNSYGTFSSSHAVAMDVAKEGTILSLDQAVAFVTDKGLMLLTGSDIQNLSQYMNGVHYVIEDDARVLFGRSAWSSLLSPLQDDTHFMRFMESARLAYDYTGERIICFNAEKDYMYVYMLRTATWHKMSMPENAEFSRLLNSYPDTYLSAKLFDIGSGLTHSRILNFSTPLDVTSTENSKAVIVTRPFDLDEPDIRKTIRSIRIRGQYNRNDVRYILLGSMDGLNWGILPSLRGGSYKLFRMIILADLSPTERISWVDIDYESRFANKLR